MAGIAGVAGVCPGTESIEKMLAVIAHRGVVAKNIKLFENAAAGVCATSLSVARGNGFAARDGVTVLFDGEIYNNRPDGHQDADVALSLYNRHGMSFPGYMEGVFACAVFKGDELILARDGVGVRPMYFSVSASGTVSFASEMKALVESGGKIQELRPGMTFSTKRGIAGFVQHQPSIDVPDDPAAAADLLRELMIKSVERRLADGAVGACLLSGGLDSSIIAACVRHLGADMPLVSVGMEGAPDLANAGLVAEHLGMKLHVHTFTADDIESLVPVAVRILESFEEDCVSGAISNLFASRKATEFTRCILSGEGGDELFGGYHLLKDLAGQSERLLMMRRLVEIAYNTAVQRLDRAMMGNGITYRTPFIDPEIMAFAANTPVDWKIRDTGSGFIEKWILREAFRDMLPEAIYKRAKLRFAGGTGTDNVMDRIAGCHVQDADFTEASRVTAGGYRLQSAKELWYYREFQRVFPDVQFEKLVGRWDPGKTS